MKEITVNKLLEYSKNSFFKINTDIRAKRVGTFKYIGFKSVFHRNKDKKLVLYVDLIFLVKGENHKGKRETYTIIAKFPYVKGIKNLKRLYDLPVKLFSSDPSFKYYFAYVFKQNNLLINNEKDLVLWLGDALLKPPTKRNPNQHKELTKHFYKFFIFISNKKPKDILDKRFELKTDFKIPILNKKI
jgi:hypothetical protein